MKIKDEHILGMMMIVMLIVWYKIIVFFSHSTGISSPDTSYYLMAATKKDFFHIRAPLFVMYLSLLGKEGYYLFQQIMGYVFTPIISWEIGKMVWKEREFEDKVMPMFLFAVVTIVHFTLVFWREYLLTETLLIFFLGTVVYFFYAKNIFYFILSSVLLCLVRPFYTFVPFILALFFKGKKAYVALVLMIIVFTIAVYYAPMTQRHYLWVMRMWTPQGRSTWGVDLIPDTEPTLTFMQGFFAKMKVFLMPYTPEMSSVHKAFRVMFFLPFYLFTIIRRDKRFAPLYALLAGFIIFHSITFVDYDLRYRLGFEYVLIFTAIGGIFSRIKIK